VTTEILEDQQAATEEETLEVPLAELRPALEAVLMVADQPLDHVTLASAVGYPPGEVSAALAALAEEYAEQGRGFDLRNVAGGWRYYTREEFAGVVERFVLDGQQARLTQAALETLAVVAYKQPVSRARVSAIRGVNVDGVMRTLQQRDLIEEVARDPGPGQAVLFGTTREFLARLGLDTIDDLPPVADLMPGADVVEALEQGLRAEPLTLPTADHEAPGDEAPVDEAQDAESIEAEPSEPVVGDPSAAFGVDPADVPEAIEEPTWMREPAPADPESSDVDVHDTSDPSDAPSSTSVE